MGFCVFPGNRKKKLTRASLRGLTVSNNFNKIISFKRLIDGDLPLARDNL
jgi:hypothetical protein